MHKHHALALVVAIAAISPACVIVDGDDSSSLEVVNDSDFVLEEIRVAEVGDDFYGPDLTGRDAIFPGESLFIVLDCGFYDVLVVDELGAECELLDLDVCFDDAVWFVDNRTLARCDF